MIIGTVFTFTSVEHVEAVVQVRKHSGGFPAQIIEIGGNILIHREPPHLLHHLILPQQVGLHRHRHVAPVPGYTADCGPNQPEPDSRQKTRALEDSETETQTLWRSLKTFSLFMFTSAISVPVVGRSKYQRGFLLVRRQCPAQPTNERPRNDHALSKEGIPRWVTWPIRFNRNEVHV